VSKPYLYVVGFEILNHGVGVTVQVNGAVGTATISENVLLDSLLSVTRPVESRVTVTGLPAPGKKKAWAPFAANPVLVCVVPLTLTTKLPEAA
jgi:hypothetical protein